MTVTGQLSNEKDDPSFTPSKVASYHPYVYGPLQSDEIRLLKAVNQDGQILYHLEHIALDTAPPYTALSYCWGDPSPIRTLVCDNLALPITDSVKVLLPYLAPESGKSYLWIDAICIDQINLKEKNHQVGKMASIYKRAESVVIWLGEGNAGVERTFKRLPAVTAWIVAWSKTNTDFDLMSQEGAPDEEFWDGISYMFSRPWFTRLWTFQEAILPPVVVFRCGRNLIHGDVVTELIEPLFQQHSRLRVSAGSRFTGPGLGTKGIHVWNDVSICRKHFASKGFVILPMLLYYSKDQQVSNPVDKVYALLGLTNPYLQNLITIRYDSTYIEVLADFVAISLKIVENSRLLNIAGGLDNGYPSWCPNLLDDSSVRVIIAGSRGRQFSAGYDGVEDSPQFPLVVESNQMSLDRVPDTDVEAKHNQELDHATVLTRNTLQVNGFIIDSVAKTIPFPHPNPSQDVAVNWYPGLDGLFAWNSRCFSLSREVYNSSEAFRDAHFRTTTCMYVGDSANEEYSYDHLDWYSERFMNHNVNLPILGPDTEAKMLAGERVIAEINMVGLGRSFFSTAKGNIGMGPKTIQPGDLICIYHQTITPFIVRTAPDDSTQYNLLGEAYVDGMMNGEAFALEESKHNQVITLV